MSVEVLNTYYSSRYACEFRCLTILTIMYFFVSRHDCLPIVSERWKQIRFCFLISTCVIADSLPNRVIDDIEKNDIVVACVSETIAMLGNLFGMAHDEVHSNESMQPLIPICLGNNKPTWSIHCLEFWALESQLNWYGPIRNNITWQVFSTRVLTGISPARNDMRFLPCLIFGSHILDSSMDSGEHWDWLSRHPSELQQNKPKLWLQMIWSQYETWYVLSYYL